MLSCARTHLPTRVRTEDHGVAEKDRASDFGQRRLEFEADGMLGRRVTRRVALAAERRA